MTIRTIRSYVLRAGRTSPRQQKGLEIHLPEYSLNAIMGEWDWSSVFANTNEVIVEIGFGMGASLLTMAKENPQTNYIGMEVHKAGLGSLAADLYEENITNVRLFEGDAKEAFLNKIKPDSLDGIQIFFPDPWPKKKHHKRRLVQPEFVTLLSSRLKPGGFLHCATDWQDYAEQMMDVLSEESSLGNTQPGRHYTPRPEARPLTKFEHRGEKLGHGVWDLMFVRI